MGLCEVVTIMKSLVTLGWRQVNNVNGNDNDSSNVQHAVLHLARSACALLLPQLLSRHGFLQRLMVSRIRRKRWNLGDAPE